MDWLKWDEISRRDETGWTDRRSDSWNIGWFVKFSIGLNLPSEVLDRVIYILCQLMSSSASRSPSISRPVPRSACVKGKDDDVSLGGWH